MMHFLLRTQLKANLNKRHLLPAMMQFYFDYFSPAGQNEFEWPGSTQPTAPGPKCTWGPIHKAYFSRPFVSSTSINFHPLSSTFIHFHILWVFVCAEVFTCPLYVWAIEESYIHSSSVVQEMSSLHLFSQITRMQSYNTFDQSRLFFWSRKDKISQSVFIKVTFQPKVKICSWIIKRVQPSFLIGDRLEWH